MMTHYLYLEDAPKTNEQLETFENFSRFDIHYSVPFQTQYPVSNPTTYSPICPQCLQPDAEHSGAITYEIFMKLQHQEQNQRICSCNKQALSSRPLINHDMIEDERNEYQIYTETTTSSSSFPTVKCPLPSPVPLLKPKPSKGKQPKTETIHRCSYPGCGKIYVQPANLIFHERLHTGDKLFACVWPGCKKKFTRVSGRQLHLRKHARDKTYCCSHCDRIFDHFGQYEIHLNLHEQRTM